MGWDLFLLNVPVVGGLVEKNTLARTTRTLGTLVQSGVPILEALTITRETCGNSMFESIFDRIQALPRRVESLAGRRLQRLG